MRVTLLGVAVAVVVTCAGCASGSAPPVGDPGGIAIAKQPGVTVGASSAAHNRAATHAEAARLLALAPLPPGATAAQGPTAGLAGPSLGMPSTSSLIDIPRFWKSSLSLAAAYQYEKSHAPAGLTLAGTGSSGSVTGGLDSEDIGWGEPNRSYAEELQVDVGIAPVAGGTIIRADGLGEWIDPRPVRDSQPGKRLRVTVAGGCPTGDRGVAGVSNPGTGFDHALLPSGAPTSALICEYGGGNPPDVFGLFAHVVVSATAAERIADQVKRLSLGHTDGDVTSCPAETGGLTVIAFQYAGQPDVDLAWAQTGCETVANGHIIVDGGLTLTRYIKAPPAL